MNGVDVTIIVPQRGHEELTLACLRSIRATDSAAWPVVVVDDGSETGSQHCLPHPAGPPWFEEFRPAEWVRLGERRGVSAAWNAGAKRAETEYVVFLNNDVLARGPWVEALVGPLRRGEASIAGARGRRETALPAEVMPRLPERLLEGWCLAMRRSLCEALGGFDESMRVYFSDTDFQARAVARCADAGLSLVDVPLVHLGHRTAHDVRCLPDRAQAWRRDRERFVEKWRACAARGLAPAAR